jgi:hypothetical protein
MADKKISALTAASTPLAGTEVLPIVQSSATVKVSVANLTAGRAVNATSIQFGSGTVLSVYEEGTWTPVVTSTVGTLSSVSATGTYTKIGRQVNVAYNILISANGTGATSIKAAGLPFTIATNRPYGVGMETDAVGFNIISQGIVSTDYALLTNFAGLYPGGTGYRLQGNFTYIV